MRERPPGLPAAAWAEVGGARPQRLSGKSADWSTNYGHFGITLTARQPDQAT
jgi:hypothetical protein